MLYLILALYFIIILVFSLLIVFIAYHLSRYSFNTFFKGIAVPFFILVSVLLLFSNMMIFLSINWQDLIPGFIIF